MKEVNAWLSDEHKDYQQGLILLQKYGNKLVYQSLLKMAETKMTLEALERSLRKIQKPEPKKKINIVVEAPMIDALAEKVKNIHLTAPNTIDQYRLAANKLYSEMAFVHAKLIPTEKLEERAKLMAKFYRLQSDWVAAMEDSKHFQEHGSPKPRQEKKVTKVAQLSGSDFHRLTALRSKVSRAERDQLPKYLAEGNMKKYNARLAEVEEWKEEIKTLENG